MKLIKYEAARQALAEAHRVDEVKDIRDKAVALSAYAQQAHDTDLITWATAIKVRAERRAGELLQETAAMGQRDRGKGGDRKSLSSRNDGDLPILRDLGITPNQSSTWQKLAKIPEPEFEQRMQKAEAEATGITTAKILRGDTATKPKPRPPRKEEKARTSSPLLRALEEGRQWMERWQHLEALTPVFAELLALIETFKGGITDEANQEA